MRAFESIKKRFLTGDAPVNELTPIDLVWIEQRVAAVLKANALESLIIGGYLQVSEIHDGARTTTGDPISLAPLGGALLSVNRAQWATYVWEWCANTIPGLMSQLNLSPHTSAGTRADVETHTPTGAGSPSQHHTAARFQGAIPTHGAPQTRGDAQTQRTTQTHDVAQTHRAAQTYGTAQTHDVNQTHRATKTRGVAQTHDVTQTHSIATGTTEAKRSMAAGAGVQTGITAAAGATAASNASETADATTRLAATTRPGASTVLISAGDFGVLATRSQDPAPDTAHGMTLAEAIPLLSMRMVSDTMTDGIADAALIRTSIPGIQAALSVGDEKWVVPRDLAAWGITAEMAAEMAESQLRGGAAPEVSIVFLDDTTPVYVLETKTAGVAALLPYLDSYIPLRESASSVVVAALANEHVVFVHLATEDNSDAAIRTLIENAVAEHTHRPGRIKPTIFRWSPDGTLEALTPNMDSAAGRLEARQLVSSGHLID